MLYRHEPQLYSRARSLSRWYGSQTDTVSAIPISMPIASRVQVIEPKAP